VIGSTVALVARFTLSAAFALSAATKLTRPAAFATSLAAFGVPAPGVVARLLPPVEAGLAVALVALPHSSAPAFAAISLLALFTAAVLANLAAGREAPCPCFGAEGDRPVSPATLVRNGLLLALAVVATGPVAGASPGPVVVGTCISVGVTVAALRRFG
jgi:uncharacterized membrane protein YphA (DoxX/SURF4 family)